MHKNTIPIILLISLSVGCSKKDPKDNVQAPQVIVEENKKSLSAAEQKAAYDKSKEEEPSDDPWGVQVAKLAKEIGDTTTACKTTYLEKLQPDQLLVGAPAVVTKDGVVTVMDELCGPLADSLKRGLRIIEGKHPETEKLARHWTLLADMYSRVKRVAVNIGASAKRRKRNHKALVMLQKSLVSTVAPAVIASAKTLSTWTADNVIQPSPQQTQMSPADAAKHWNATFKKTTADAKELHDEWLKRGHDLLKAELYARLRYLKWLGRYWQRRIPNELEQLRKTRTGNADFDKKLHAAGESYYTALRAYYDSGYGVAMLAMEDIKTIDQPRLKEGKIAVTNALKAFNKAVRRIKAPKP